MNIIFLVVVIICSIVINRLYHKLFDVTYFGCNAVIIEWFVSFIIGGMLAGIPFYLLGLI